ncbi:alpha/beta hydrolase fold domain-containing protein [Flammeovirga yaeyamensis]|uniref:Alpha/beta hydrolase fold domain-containing protein n=1 Tax=Flammeovirga yaeyamensis TaxID=367791 RepID=A0AAX1NCF6_9BACT|nr:alpha/beta hydrolase [Flammeovirga yaeyamensis]MBB3696813.1 acetyl esterase/lipase [Flammeovirga yaeyamensis]NMF33478.1 alpha/beta hydrolase [Flammeovirga yaeyamensis]QWG05248.1 alpha/beta hydrolase fold domain-containing protein [Flammeovirga yaeyamensis]
MKLLTFLSFYFLIVSQLCAQHLVPLWEEDKIPNYTATDDKEYIAPNRDFNFTMNIQKPEMEIMLPSKRSSNGKAVLILPGGGYAGVSYDWEGTEVGQWLNSNGIAAFVLKYRMPQAASVKTSYKAPIQDAQRAMRYIRAHAEEFNIDKDKIGVMGFSAGGHLASTLATHQEAYYTSNDKVDEEAFQPNFLMLLYPVISMQKGVTHEGSKNKLLGKSPDKKLVDQFSNELQVNDKTPTTFIVHSGDDGAVPVENSIRFYQALVKHKVMADMHLYPEGGHGYGMGIANKNAPKWKGLAELWLSELK